MILVSVTSVCLRCPAGLYSDSTEAGTGGGRVEEVGGLLELRQKLDTVGRLYGGDGAQVRLMRICCGSDYSVEGRACM